MPRVGETGATNDQTYHAQKLAVLARNPQLDQFAALFVDAQPGTNVDAEKVLYFDQEQAILHARALAIAKANGDTAAGLAEFEARTWTARRQAFEDLWAHGRRFLYCAPNPGTLGARAYGDYCLIVDPDTLQHADTAVFPRDTAQTYTDGSAVVDAARAYQEVGSWPARSGIALVHYEAPAVSVPAADWAELICGSDSYMEVVTAGPLSLSQVMVLRVDADTWQEHDELWWDWKQGLLFDPTDRAKAMAYDALIGWPDLHIEIIDGDGP